MPRYTSQSEFMHDFVAGATAKVSDKNVTSTYLRAKKRQEAKINDWASRQIRSSKQIAADEKMRKARDRDNSKKYQMFADVARSVQKKNPGMSWIKARKEARVNDPQGRKIWRMIQQGSSSKEIAKSIGKGKSGVKVSIGKSSG